MPHDAPMRPADDPSWSYYAETVLEVGDPVVAWAVTAGPTSADRAALRGQGIPDAFAIVTPCNPLGQPHAAATNAEALTRAAADLSARGWRWWRGDGRSPDGTHREPGFVLAVPREAARALACAWRQSAFWYVEGEAVWLCGACVAAPDARLTPAREPATPAMDPPMDSPPDSPPARG